MHLDALEEWLLDQDPRYETILKQGQALDRQLQGCVTNLHIQALQDVKSPIVEGSFKAPFLASAALKLILAATDVDLDAADAKPFAKLPAIVKVVDKLMLKSILSTVADYCTREELKKKVKKLTFPGSELLAELHTQRDTVLADSSTYGDKSLRKLRKIVKAGIGVPRVAAFKASASPLPAPEREGEALDPRAG